MKLRHPGLIRFVAFLASYLFRLWMSTLRVRIDARALREYPVDCKKERHIYTFWHDSILASTQAGTPVHVLVSQHSDGELIAQMVQFLGFGVVRGSSTRGGVGALLGLMSVCQRAHIAINPDGPRGPARKVQLGLVFLASRSGLPIVPLAFGYSNAWYARSWDRFVLPKPFSSVYMLFGAPIHVPAKLGRAGLEQQRQFIEERLLALTEVVETWARTGKSPPPVTPVVRASA